MDRKPNCLAINDLILYIRISDIIVSVLKKLLWTQIVQKQVSRETNK
jgi:hypothetical protein